MANTIMASSKTLITSSLPSTPKPHNLPQIPTLKVPKLKQPNFQKLLTLTSTTSSVAAAILAMAPPSIAAEIEKAALFDFNLTLPIIMAEFLILMVSLDKIYYSPLGKFMDDRDAEIKEKLNSVKDTTAEVKQMEDQADAIMKAARAEIAAALSKMKKEMTAETEEKLAEGKKKITVEIEEAMVKLEAQKEETLKALDSQIAALSDDIVRKVIPL